MSDIPAEKWDAARLPDGFTAADGVVLMAIESGALLAPWQFDWIARYYTAALREDTRHRES
jgi:hypothetical protein